MNKKILIGSMLVFIMLLLMPSIPAIQLKTYENEIHNDFFTRIENIDFNDLKSIIIEGIPDHPILFIWVMFTFYFRLARAELYYDIASDMDEDLNFFIYHPLLLYWSVILIYSAVIKHFFWGDLAEEMEWNWKEFI